jgi:hypothetical protein
MVHSPQSGPSSGGAGKLDQSETMTALVDTLVKNYVAGLRSERSEAEASRKRA